MFNRAFQMWEYRGKKTSLIAQEDGIFTVLQDGTKAKAKACDLRPMLQRPKSDKSRQQINHASIKSRVNTQHDFASLP